MRYINQKNVSTASPLHHILNWHTPFDKKTPKSTLLPFLILPISFVLLNIDHYFADQRQNFTVFKDYLGWVFYVVIHLVAPILTAVYLYIFQAPGTVKCFSIALGLQNCCSVLTHLLIPMAPPWFTHLYGINDVTHLNYETKGYAAGLVRVDSHLGTHLTSNGFHKSPIVFGAVPSVHGAMAFQCFLFVMTQSRQGWGVTAWNPLRNISSSRLLLLNSKKDDDCEINTFELNNSDGSDSIDLYNTEEDEYERSVYSEQSLSSALENDGVSNASCDLISKYDMTPLPDLTNSNKFTKFIYWLIKNSVISRFLVSVFLVLQWWATMYVDHHYRFDLFIGELYALVSFYLVNRFILQKKVIPNFLRKRENKGVYDEDEDDGEDKTMGMRVFGDTKIGWVFDPLYS
ncbi:related to Inositolphosphotransferase 1 [Saccharomycodes ludwigii]|uniref:Related to Inositolphosphotransferase 1 n=1 Tax=Saccharomycodes ludwigii TaxID=36035 RepID=A0A376BC29_9ASCO|nr:related to Inositolphosphotransferase 1 [Saccharomycodes ludwigii]